MEEMSQGTEQWLQWRSKGLGASDAPIIMSVSPYKTRIQLWEEKIGIAKPFEGNWATQRGTNLEPKARACYELEHGVEMLPILAEHKEYPFIRASLDGYNAKLNRILEIKCPRRFDHEKALAGEVPEKYYAQIQHQFLVTGAFDAHYYSFDGEKGVTITVVPSVEYCEKLLNELIYFWDLVQKRIEPDPDPKRDYQKIQDDALFGYTEEWRIAKFKLGLASKALAEIEEKIRAGLQVPRAICNGLRLTKSLRKGSVDYSKIPELDGVNLESYRKPSTETFSIRILKDEKTEP